MQPDAVILGFDVGTSAVKGALYDMGGHCVFERSVGYSQSMPRAGWLEQDADDWLRSIREIACDARDKAGGRSISAIGICSQVNTHVFVDDAGMPLRRAIVWQDQRCASVAEEMRGRAVRDKATANAPLDASSALCRAEWVRRYEPQVWVKTRWILSPKDYCIFALTGCAVTDPMTSIGLVDMQGNYLDHVIQLVDGLEQRLAPVRPVTAHAGHTQVTWLPREIPVATGTMDAWASAYGSGMRSAGDAFQVAGTSEVIGMLSGIGQAGPGIVAFPKFNGLHLHAGPTQAGGDALRWFAEALGRSIDGLLAMAESPAAPDEPLLFLPHLMGERAPVWDSEARAAFIGLSKRHREPDLALAVLRGVALSSRHLLEAVEHSANSTCKELRISGGASQSDLWCQIKADVMNRRLHRVRNRDSSVFGAAMLAQAGMDSKEHHGDFEVERIQVERTFEPDRKLKGLYDALFGAYRSAYEGLKPTFAALARIRSA